MAPTSGGRVPCPHCPTTFSRRSRMLEHVRRRHEHRVVFPCWQCDFTSPDPQAVRDHERRAHGPDGGPPADLDLEEAEQAMQGQFRVHRARFRPPVPLVHVEERTRAAGTRALARELAEHGVLYAALALYVRFERLDELGRLTDVDVSVFRSDGAVLHLSDLDRLGEQWGLFFDRILERLADFKTQGSNWVITHATALSLETARARHFGGGDATTAEGAIDVFLSVALGEERKRGVTVLAGDHCFDRSVRHVLGPGAAFVGAREVDGLVKLSAVRRFEADNPDLSVNVLYASPSHGVVPVYVSGKRRRLGRAAARRLRQVNLLLVFVEWRGALLRHYVPVTDLAALLSPNRNRKHVCLNCCQSFWRRSTLLRHERLCLDHAPQRLVMPPPDRKMEFRNVRALQELPVVGVCDFEACMDRPDTRCTVCADAPGLRDKCPHVTVRLHEQKPILYHLMFFDVGRRLVYESSHAGTPEETMAHFFAALREADDVITEAVSRNHEMAMSPLERQAYLASDACYMCRAPFRPDDPRVRDHDHYTGRYLGPAHRSCNLRRRVSTSAYPVFAHNLTSYDSHFLLRYLRREDVQREGYLSAIPINGEKFKCVSVGAFRFVDSLNFLGGSLAALTDNLRAGGGCDFALLRRAFPGLTEGQLELLLRKGVYPYEWVRSAQFLRDQPELPPREAFRSELSGGGVSDEDYAHARRVFRDFGCRHMLDYTDLYCRLDVVLLAECLFAFRASVRRHYGLDMAQYITLPQLSYDAMLRLTGARVGLIHDVDQLLFVEHAIRGGVSFVNQRHARGDVDPEDAGGEHLLYVDANNLYGWAQSQPLPYDNFRWLGEAELADLDWTSMTADQAVGYVVECDLDYPPELYADHQSFPLAPDNVTVTEDMLSDFSRRSLKERRNYSARKLLGWFGPRRRYVTHYRNLQLYLSLGLRLRRVRRVLAFDQRDFVADYIAKTAELRAGAATEFERNIHKLMSNAVYGKSLQNKRNYGRVSFYYCPRRAARAMGEPNVQCFRVINDELVAVFTRPEEVEMDRCYAVGMSVLDLSKLFMFDRYYRCIRPALGPTGRVLMSDTDSFLLYFWKKSRHAVLRELRHLMDFSNYPPEHPLYDASRKSQLGYFKDEMAGRVAIVEYAGIRSKSYALRTRALADGAAAVHNRSKGVCKRASRTIAFEQYLECLREEGQVRVATTTIRSHNHRLFTIRQRRKCFDSFDDKRAILQCGIHSLPHAIPGGWQSEACSVCPPPPLRE